ncbi:MAG: hypothetical protein QXP31_00045 [Pyrobaculum sp.]
MVDVEVVVSSLISQAPLVAIAVLILYYKIRGVENKVIEIGKTVKNVEARVSNIETRLNSIETRLESFANYQETLLDFLAAEGVVEHSVLRGHVRTLYPRARSRYYTEEAERRLVAILDKDLDEITWDDLTELDNIAELIFKEYLETGREDLRKYYPKLKFFIAAMRGYLRRKEWERQSSATPQKSC